MQTITNRRPSIGPMTLRAVIGGVLVAAIFALLPAQAHAGQYMMDTCDVPGHRTLDHGAWETYEQASNGSFVDTCGGSPTRFGVGDANDTLTGDRGWRLNAPAGISIRSARYWYGIDHGATANGLESYPVGCSSLRSCSDDGDGDVYEYPANTRQIAFGLRCTLISCTTGNNAEFLVYGARVTLEEALLPTASITGGSVVASGDVAGTRTLTFEVADAESGVERVEAYLDGALVGWRSYGGECAHENWNACATARSGELSLDTTLVPDGPHSIELVAIDAAGNERRVPATGPVRVDNVPAPANSSLPAIAGRPRVGDELTASPGTWNAPGASFTYRWERCSDSSCEEITAANRQTYNVREVDLGRRIRVAVTAANAEGSAEATSEPTSPIEAVAIQAPPVPRPAAGGSGFASAPSTPTAPNGTHASARARIRAGVGPSRKRSVRARYSKTLSIRGVVTDEHSRPVEHALVTLHERISGASAYRVAGQARTGDGGRFTWRTGRTGTRLIKAGYSAVNGGQPSSFSAPIRVNVSAPVTLRATRRTRNRGRAVFSGRILGATMRRGGIVVEMQARTGKRWRTFATTRVRRSGGSFRYRYRFTRTYSTRSYRFRARVRKQAGLPFATGSSPVVRVHVRGGR